MEKNVFNLPVCWFLKGIVWLRAMNCIASKYCTTHIHIAKMTIKIRVFLVN